MPETQPTTQDEAGVTRTLTGEISSPSTSTPATETIVRPQATPQPTTPQSTETRTPDAPKPPRSLINEESPTSGAPETYSDFTVPEGFALDKDLAGEFTALAKKGDLSQTYAQELV